MNICILSRFFQQKMGGIETYTFKMANAFARRGHRVHIITTNGNEKFHLVNFQKGVHLHKINCNIPVFPGYWKLSKIIPLSTIIFHILISKKIKEVVKKYAIDIVEVPDFEGYRPIFRRKFPLVVRLHGYHGFYDDYVINNKSLSKCVLRKWSALFLNKADTITSVSEAFSKQISQIFMIKKEKMITNFTGIEQKLFSPAPQNNNSSINVLFVGKLTKSKGVEVLCEAIFTVALKYPKIKFVIIGRDTLMEDKNYSYREYLTNKLINFNVQFIDEVSEEDLVKYYQKSKICVFPSLYEPGGTVCLESMSCGCATIVSDTGGYPEFIHNRVDGLIVPVGNHKLLAEAIIELLENEALRSRISKNGLEKARERFNLDNAVDRTLEMYQAVIDRYNNKPKKNANRN